MAIGHQRGGGPPDDGGAPMVRSYWHVALPLFAVVVAVVVAAFLLDTRLRPWASHSAEVTVGQPVSSAFSPTGVGLQAGAADKSSSSKEAVAPSAQSSAPPSLLEQQIKDAYQNYLDVYSQAIFTLDTTHLTDVLAGQALTLVSDEVNGLKAQGRPAKVIEDNRSIAVVQAAEDHALLIDEYTSQSVYIDPTTKRPLPRTGPPDRVRQSYQFQKLNGVWKIVSGTREVLGSS